MPQVKWYEATEAAKRITMHVQIRGLQRWLWRLMVARALIVLAAWVAGFGGVEIQEADIRQADVKEVGNAGQ